MNSNHTDYNWNATAAAYDAAMLAELDFYLQQIADTSGAPAEVQARYTPDNWWWMWLYEHNRTPEQFAELLDAIRSGHITVPLNPFVTLYGALPTEAVIRAGYYPGRIGREHGIEFPLAEAIETAHGGVESAVQCMKLGAFHYLQKPFEIDDAPDGQTGLRMASELAPDLILLDVNMPGIDGIEVAPDGLRVSSAEFEQASVSDDVDAAIDDAIAHLRSFNEAQMVPGKGGWVAGLPRYPLYSGFAPLLSR